MTMDAAVRRMYLAGLIATWDNRDALYMSRTRREGEKRVPRPLTEAEREAIRAFRRTEVECLDEPERGLALQVLREWKP